MTRPATDQPAHLAAVKDAPRRARESERRENEDETTEERLARWTREAEEWPDPIPFARRAVPAFPVKSLVGSVADFVAELAEETQTPVDLAGTLALGILASTAAGRVVVNPSGSWIEPTNLYTVCALKPGSMKSAVLARMIAPLLDYEEAQLAESLTERETAKARHAIALGRAKEAEKAATKADTDDDKAEADEKAAVAAVAAAGVTVPPIPRLLADDSTPEALTSLLAEQGGRVAVFSPEGGIFDAIAGRYSSASNLDVYLKSWSGDTIKVDRKGRAPESIKSPALTIGLAVQPWTLQAIAHLPGFRGRGLLARFLWSMPEPTLGVRNVRNPRPMDENTLRAWRELVRKMASSFGAETGTLTLTAEARERFTLYREALEPRLAATGDLDHLTDFGGKLHGQVIRLAAVTHLAENVTRWGEPIGLAAMERAVTLADYFLDHALAVFEFMDPTRGFEDATAVLRWITDQGKPTFTRRECHRAHESRFPTVEDLAATLATLEAHGYVRALPQVTGEKGGRPSQPYAVHPRQTTQPTKPAPAGGSAGSVDCRAPSLNGNDPAA